MIVQAEQAKSEVAGAVGENKRVNGEYIKAEFGADALFIRKVEVFQIYFLFLP